MDQAIYHIKTNTGFIRYVLLILWLLSTAGCKNQEEVRILFTGDILLARNVREEYQQRNESPWKNLQPLFRQADLVIGNLEGSVGETYRNTPNPESLIFDINKEDIAILRNAGFNAITTENNHSRDLDKGFDHTFEALTNHRILPIGFDNSPQFLTIKDVVISIVAINVIAGKDGVKNQIPSIEIMQKLRLAKTLSNVVIVSIHWGNELLEWPDKNQREITDWLIEYGVDIIIGSHPHIIQKPEIIKGKPVFFSLGNHLFDQKYPATKEGLIADIRIKNGKVYCSGIITHTMPNSFFPEIAEHLDYGIKSFKLNNLFKAGSYTLQPISVNDSIKTKIRLQAFHNNKRAWTTPALSLTSIESGKFDGKNEYLLTLEKHYSNMDGEVSLRPYVYGINEKGIYACWRGSALAWPLLDAQISPYDRKTLCALHRGDSFINIDQSADNKRIAAYEWNGFGFSGVSDSTICKQCEQLYPALLFDK